MHEEVGNNQQGQNDVKPIFNRLMFCGWSNQVQTSGFLFSESITYLSSRKQGQIRQPEENVGVEKQGQGKTGGCRQRDQAKIGASLIPWS